MRYQIIQMAKKVKQTDTSTEEKIMTAAKKVFMQKGYGATRTRDIANEAGINLALLNYYFRSKEKLFEIIMIEKVQTLFGVLAPVVMNDQIPLEQKIEMIVQNYIDMLLQHPDLPIFVLSELKNNPVRFSNMIQAGHLLTQSSFVKQLHVKAPHINPLHFLMSILGMTVFPFVGRPLFQTATGMNNLLFNQMMEERRRLIPVWVKAMLDSDPQP